MRSITFVLPMPARVPIGGYKVVYEYADLLAEKYNVNIVYSVILPYVKNKYPSIIRFFAAHYILNNKKYCWYSFKNKVNFKVVWNIDDNVIPDSDVVIATAWETADPISKLSRSKGAKYYFIQHYETWAGEKILVERTYLLGLKNIVIARWIEEKIKCLGGTVHAYIPNGINFNAFQLESKIESRNPHTIAMMYHTIEWKGAKDGIEALNLVRNVYKNISVTLFSVVPKSRDIPSWVNYVCNPSLDELVKIYNSNAIFLCPSWSEGFGLPGAEALACGCALVTTDNGGCRDYAIDGETALLSQPRNSEELAKHIICFLKDNEFRIRIAKQGYNLIQKFTWENSLKTFEEKIIINK